MPLRLFAALYVQDSTVYMVVGTHAIAWDRTAVPTNYYSGDHSVVGDIILHYPHTANPQRFLEEIEREVFETQEQSEDMGPGDLLAKGFNHLDGFMNLLISRTGDSVVPSETLENYKALASRSTGSKSGAKTSQYQDIVFNVYRYAANNKLSKQVDMTFGTHPIVPADLPGKTAPMPGRIDGPPRLYNTLGYGMKKIGFIHFYDDPEKILREVAETAQDMEGRKPQFDKVEFLEYSMFVLRQRRDVTVPGVVTQQWKVAVTNYKQAYLKEVEKQRDRRRKQKEGLGTVGDRV
ncbi:hypothetical protein EV361DRAFT_167358 [Lentinula raphanica]|nr:hypothetical protein EV361DRAFT_167358 [Lentinula raphanica]